MNYWIEKTYPSNRVPGDFTSLLLSPATSTSGANIYANMKKVSVEDIIFHLDQDTNSLVGYSEAADNYNLIKINGDDYLSVDLQHFQLFPNPIDIDIFLSKPINQNILTLVKQESEVFYQEKAGRFSLKQGGYLTKLDERIVELLNCIIPITQIAKPSLDEEEENFKEGKVRYRLHKHKERSKKLIKLAKKRFQEKNNGRLYCEACGFDFVKVYGSEIGEGFIEAHHILPISTLRENHDTKVSDLVLLCSNCHRMIHRKRPWLSINQLQNLIQKP